MCPTGRCLPGRQGNVNVRSVTTETCLRQAFVGVVTKACLALYLYYESKGASYVSVLVDILASDLF